MCARYQLFVILIITIVQFASNAPSGNGALLYLSHYGYLSASPKNSSALLDDSALRNALEEFQSFAGLDVTGTLDHPTLEAMSLPRCGVKDKVGTAESRAKRYALQGSRWKVKNLTYKISKYPKNLNPKDVDKEILRAFNVWADFTDLTFTPTDNHVHIDIRFEYGEHGDGDPFDGPGGTLAHAYFPVFGGDAHFDAAEKWTINSYKGTNLFQVAAHEFGHSLGLSHSDVKEALMAPFYRGYNPIFELHQDDVDGIQALYGKRSKPPSDSGFDEDFDESRTEGRKHPAPTPNVTVDQSLCHDSKLDTIFNSAEGYTYIFRGKKYWRLTEDSVAPGYPKLIALGWPGLPGDLDAAFTYKNGKTYFFKGSKYWRYKGRKMDGEYPKDISEGFTGIPDDLDTAMVWSGNGKIYFFKGSKFWRFDPAQRPPVKATYPKLLANWEGVPNHLDAAFQWTNGYTYFFKNDGYYRFNDRQFAVEKTTPEFPRAISYWWYGCKDAPKGTISTSESRSWLVRKDDVVGNEESGLDDSLNKNQFTGNHQEPSPLPSTIAMDNVPDNNGSTSNISINMNMMILLLFFAIIYAF